MRSIYLEHANITVSNLDKAILFFTTAFPHFKIRGGGESNGKKWIHLGDTDTYLALNESIVPVKYEKNYNTSGINHIGFVVKEVGVIAEKLLAAGFQRDFPRQEEKFRTREYFADDDGNEYEFVEYFSNLPEEKNQY